MIDLLIKLQFLENARSIINFETKETAMCYKVTHISRQK